MDVAEFMEFTVGGPNPVGDPGAVLSGPGGLGAGRDDAMKGAIQFDLELALAQGLGQGTGETEFLRE